MLEDFFFLVDERVVSLKHLNGRKSSDLHMCIEYPAFLVSFCRLLEGTHMQVMTNVICTVGLGHLEQKDLSCQLIWNMEDDGHNHYFSPLFSIKALIPGKYTLL